MLSNNKKILSKNGKNNMFFLKCLNTIKKNKNLHEKLVIKLEYTIRLRKYGST